MSISLVLADRASTLKGSATLALATKAKALLNAGNPVLDFSVGEPDFATPRAIKNAAVKAIQDNHTKYTPVAGLPELREAIAEHLHQRLGVAYAPRQVIVSCGAKHALYNALQVLCQRGDEVVLFSPYWVSYPAMIQLSGANVVPVDTHEPDAFQPDPDDAKKAITKRTKAILLNSPSNPTGAILDEERLKAIARLAVERGLVVISDEIYDQLVFPPHTARSIVQVEPRLAGQTIVVNGVSKTYRMTGWRIGYAAGPQVLIEAMAALQSHSTSNPTSISQHAALEAVRGDQREVRAMVSEFHRRRDRLVNGLNRLPGLTCFMPQGAFYAWCNVRRLGQSASTIAARWLDEALVVVVPGEEFGSPDHVRFSFATSREVIDEGLERLARWLSSRRPSRRTDAVRSR